MWKRVDSESVKGSIGEKKRRFKRKGVPEM